jgi:hypothetical protein
VVPVPAIVITWIGHRDHHAIARSRGAWMRGDDGLFSVTYTVVEGFVLAGPPPREGPAAEAGFG